MQRDVHAEAAAAIALVARPTARRAAPPCSRTQPAGRRPARPRSTSRAPRPARRRRRGARSKSERRRVHRRAHPISRAACRYQSARYGGMYRPEHQHDREMHEHRDQRRPDAAGAAPSSRRTPSAAPCRTPPRTRRRARRSRNGVAHGCSRMAVVRIMNSLANTPNGGMPRIASVPSISPQPIVGLIVDQAADVVHHLRAGLLRGVADGEEDRRLGERVHGHVQQPGEVRDRRRPCRTRT